MSAVETVKTLMGALQSGDMELAANMLADTFEFSGFTPKALNKGQFLALQSAFVAAMPDFSYNFQQPRREGDHVNALMRVAGTHQNDFSLPMFGLASILATGIAVTLPQTPVTFGVADDKVTTMQIDIITGGGLSGLLQQIGSELPLATRERNITD